MSEDASRQAAGRGSGGALASAVLSECGTYRYRLLRIWDVTRPMCVFVMLNPSTADASQDDPTIRKCVGFARRWGCGGIEVVNLFALRATDPREIRRHADPIGPDNDRHIREAVTRPGAIVCLAWGTHGRTYNRAWNVWQDIIGYGVATRDLGLTKCGQPRHPLMQPYPKATEEAAPLSTEGASQ
jgi:hypothetical protein